MQGILLNTEIEAKELSDNLTLSVKSLFDENTTAYSYYFKHPTKELFCVPILDNGKYWKTIEKQIINSTIETVSSDWFFKEEI